MTFIKSLIHKILNKEISNIYNKRFDTFNNTPKGVFWNSKLSQDLRLNIILDKILQNSIILSLWFCQLKLSYSKPSEADNFSLIKFPLLLKEETD